MKWGLFMARYAIYGAGSLGTVLGAFITKNGGQVDLINRNKAHVEALNTKGAKIIGTVDMTIPVKAITPDQMEGKYDVIVVWKFYGRESNVKKERKENSRHVPEFCKL